MRKRQMEPCFVRENKKLVKTNSGGGYDTAFLSEWTKDSLYGGRAMWTEPHNFTATDCLCHVLILLE